MLTQLIQVMEGAIRALERWPCRTIHLFHHNDADGLSSAAILFRAFERAGYDLERVCLEKTYPAVLKNIFAQSGRILVFADFAGRIAPLLSRLNQKRNLILILDHHVAEPAGDPNVYNLDPELFGFKGDRDMTASTTCYLFARTMDSSNREFAHLAVIGAVGDGFLIDNRLVGHNRDTAREAANQGTLEIKSRGRGERYILNSPGGAMPCDELSAYLDTLGGAGYYQNGPEMGIRVCLEGFSPESDQMYSALKAIQTAAFKKEIAKIQSGNLRHTPHIQWFHVQNRFDPMGVKMIGSFCNTIKKQACIDAGRYIAGFQRIPDEIPGFGDIAMNQVKISMRVPSILEAQIRKGKALGLNILLPEATGRVGGFSDACHSLAAATTITIGKEEELVEEMEKILRESNSNRKAGGSKE